MQGTVETLMADQATKTVGKYVNWISKYVEACLEDINNMRQLQAQEQAAGRCIEQAYQEDWVAVGVLHTGREAWTAKLSELAVVLGVSLGWCSCWCTSQKACVLTYCCCLPWISCPIADVASEAVALLEVPQQQQQQQQEVQQLWPPTPPESTAAAAVTTLVARPPHGVPVAAYSAATATAVAAAAAGELDMFYDANEAVPGSTLELLLRELREAREARATTHR
jgi:hypothetical protein